MSNINDLITVALNESKKTATSVDPVRAFAKAAAHGYMSWLSEKVSTDVEQGSNEAVSGSPYLASKEDPGTKEEQVLESMVEEANIALKEQGATHTTEPAAQWVDSTRVASDFENSFNQAFSDEIQKLSAEGEATQEAVVNDAANTAKVTGALQEGVEGVNEAELAEEISEEVSRREAPGYGGTADQQAR